MVKNKIRDKREQAGLTQRELAAKLNVQHKSSAILSFIESGKALPTKPYLKALCEALNTDVEDLYNSEDINLLGAKGDTRIDIQIEPSTPSDKNHTGLVEFRVWITPTEKATIERVTAFLGYRNLTEWFRESYRTLIHRVREVGFNATDRKE